MKKTTLNQFNYSAKIYQVDQNIRNNDNVSLSIHNQVKLLAGQLSEIPLIVSITNTLVTFN